ncbi:MAG TPA: hypothetical protein VGN83_15105 [Falsiroseomonas sp.]|jgi:hypothetical protein|nr:hypothetical protein [Falsiroseomonas sp.]
MRRILLVLIALACSMPAAEAARRDTNRGEAASRPAQQAGKQARPQPTRPQASRRQGTRQQTARPRSARQTTTQRRALRRGDVRTSRSGVAARGASAATVSRGVAGWQRGLPVANYTQRECPDGTLATLARGHDDVVRCMPL